MLHGVSAGRMEAIDGYLYYIGGYVQDTGTTHLSMIYVPGANVWYWSGANDMQITHRFCSAVHRHFIYSIGGHDGTGVYKLHEPEGVPKKVYFFNPSLLLEVL